jgi:hypothetical protein
VVQATGNVFGPPGAFPDKEYITAWGNGNAIVTWTTFIVDGGFNYISSPIYDSVTHDGGLTWSAPQMISGSAPFCVGYTVGGFDCNSDQGSIPTIAADGSIYVAFINTSDFVTARDQYLVVKIDPATGARIAGPFKVADLIDGYTDFPISIDGQPTYQDSQFRTWAVGNITADPTSAGHLAVVWSDMRNSVLPAPTDPYAAKTNSDVIVSQSFDGGATWSAPVALMVPNDQFLPWGAFDTTGRLRIGYFDRSYDPVNHMYGYTLATETTSGSLVFGFTQLTTALSDPTRNDRWFAGRTANPAFPHPTTFIGDYTNVGSDPSTSVGVALWTDMSIDVCFGLRCGHGENAFYASF